MRHCPLIVLLTLAACEPSQLPVEGAVTQTIIGGVAEPSHWYVVMVGNNSGGTCTGTLLSRRTVITAGHCRGGSFSLSRVYFDMGNPLVRTSVPTVGSLRHPQYKGTEENDLALVQLAQDAPVQAVPLLRETMTTSLPWIGPKYTFVGFGDSNASGAGFGTRRVVTFPIDLIGPAPVVHPGPIPAGSPTSVDSSEWYYQQTIKNTCFGDSGGPAFVVRNGVERHAGATSYGDSNCAYDGVQARTDATNLAWIQQTIDLWEGANDPCKSDGVCGSGCAITTPAPLGTLKDPDCADQHCGADGVCVLSCAAADADCASLTINDCTDNGICQPACIPADVDCAAGTGALGSPCSLGGECASGFCSGNLCCDSACTGGCEACSADGGCGLKPAATVCRPSAGSCDEPEACSGTVATCPADLFAPAALLCRASTSVCDAPESCTGAEAACPADAFAPASVVCRAPIGPCDAPETCTSTSSTCPADALRTMGETCRIEVGACDVPEACDGLTATCGADRFALPGSVCRPVTGGCDLAELCTGTADCPSDTVQPPGTECRPSASACDAAEACNGFSDLCPSDKAVSNGAVCSGGTCMAGLCAPTPIVVDAGPAVVDAGRPAADAGADTTPPRGCGCSSGGGLFILAALLLLTSSRSRPAA